MAASAVRIDHAHIQRWVKIHQGKPRDRSKEYTSKKNTNEAPAPALPPESPPPPPPDAEKAKLTHQLQQAQLKIALLEEVIHIAQAEQGLVVPKKFTTKPSKLSGKPNI